MTDDKENQLQQPRLTVHDFYFETPLYEPVDIDNIEGDIFSGTVDGYSNIDNRDTTYGIEYSNLGFYVSNLDNMRSIILTDKRTDTTSLAYFVYMSDDNKKVVKIGQVPSLATIQFADMSDKYKNVLSKDDLFMLKRAVGLAAHGTGIGSFVYLRRVLENLIWETYRKNQDNLEISKADFESKRIKEKIQALKKYLPANMTKMTPLYGILSKGIHELTEKECLAYFDTMKLAIELILRQKIQQKREDDEEAETTRRLREATQQLAQKVSND